MPQPRKSSPRRSRLFQCLLLLVSLGAHLTAAGTETAGLPWEERLAKLMSARLELIQESLRRINDEQADLPELSLEAAGGTGGLATFAESADVSANEPERRIEVFWDTPEWIDLVAVVPARQFDKRGLILDYGLPDAFSIELVAEDGSVVPVAHERSTRSLPEREGYPFVYALEKPVLAVGLRIKIERVHQVQSAGSGRYLFAFSEVMCFASGKNVARGARVSTPHKSNLFIHWRWRNSFLVDGQTSLGLPEVPAGQHAEIGWLSNAHQTENKTVWIVVDLGRQCPIDGIQVFPVRRPSLGNVPGFGLPQSYRVSVSASGAPGSFQTVLDHSSTTRRNPGQNPLLLRFPSVSARFVKFEATKVWRAFENYLGFMALSEIQVLEGMSNLAAGAEVLVSERGGRLPAHEELFWNQASLTDGYSSQGQLLELDKWLLGLDKRLRLQKEKTALLTEAESILDTVRSRVFAVALFLAIGGLFLSVFLPLRYRVSRRREVAGIRQRIAGDLHDEVGSNLGCIQVYSDLLQQQLPASQELGKIRRISAETVTSVRDIVWLLRAKTGERVSIIEHLKESSRIMLDRLECSFKVDESLAGYKVDDQTARNLILFFREALHNILRHADARNVSIEIERIEDSIKLSISDDGRGITPEKLDAPECLHALKERSKRLGAEFRAGSEQGKGTTIDICFTA